jgi:hypothetical protein
MSYIYFFICVLFNSAISGSDYPELNDRMINKQILEDVERGDRGLVSSTIPEFAWRN